MKVFSLIFVFFLTSFITACGGGSGDSLDNDHKQSSIQITENIGNTTLSIPIVNVVNSGSQLEVSWSDSNAYRYRLLYWKEGEKPTQHSSHSLNFILEVLTSGNYFILVEAYDELGNSLFSKPVSVEV